MCGIVGLTSKEGIDRDTMLSMTRALAHRGPDAHGVFLNDGATTALGHTRLSVVDLTSKANQPFRSSDGRYTLVFNGEIYNYSVLRNELISANSQMAWRTESDTEVILNGFIHWGAEICQKLDGMFALAIYDQDKDQFFLCRDRIGKKPLFYFQKPGIFAFASEMKALLMHPVVRRNSEVNYDALYTFLHLGYIPEPATARCSILKFPAGHYAVVRDGFMSITSYFSLRDKCMQPKLARDETVRQRLKATLSKAVEKRLMGDVPLGAFLSGGTDSSLIAAMANELRSNGPLKTYSIGFRESKFDEAPYARKVADVLKTDHTEYMLHEDEAVGLIEPFTVHFDEPFADTSAIPMMIVSKLARQSVTVALTGDGADELFLGYGAYDWANRLDTLWMKALRAPLAYGLKRFGNSRMRRAALLLRKVDSRELRSHIFSQEQYYFSRREILEMSVKSTAAYGLASYADPQGCDLTPAEKQALFDLLFYLKDDLLVKVDRMSMLFGLECRCPFLDPEVVSLALSLPYEMKHKGTDKKWILKDILGDYLPSELIYRPKWGFSIPLGRWMKNDLAYLTKEYLNESTVTDIGLVNYQYVKELKSAFDHGEEYLYHRLWVLIVAHKWLYENGAR